MSPAIEVLMKPFGQRELDLQRICRVRGLEHVGNTPSEARCIALVVRTEQRPVREYCNALLDAMHTFLAVFEFQMTFVSDRKHVPVFVVMRMTLVRVMHNLEAIWAPSAWLPEANIASPIARTTVIPKRNPETLAIRSRRAIAGCGVFTP